MKEYTLQQAAHVTGLSEQSIRRYVKLQRLPSIRRDGQYYVTDDDVNQFFNKKIVKGHVVKTGIAVPSRSESKEVLALINSGFKDITDGITSRYQDTVKPIIDHTISTDRQAFMNELATIIQTMLNNMLSITYLPNCNKLSPEQMLEQLTEGIDVPDELKQHLSIAFNGIYNDTHKENMPVVATL